MKTPKKMLTLSFIAILSTMMLVVPVYACDYGLTPGFWKNHPEYWPNGFDSETLFSDVFGCDVQGATLMEALRFKGGSGVEGAERILARAAVALLFNDIVFGGAPWWVKSETCSAIASGDRDTMLTLAAQFDIWNNQGPPLGWTWP